MTLLLRNVLLTFVIFWFHLVDHCSPGLNKRVVSVALERPKVIDINPKLVRCINVTSRRHGRFDPVHYVHLWLHYLKPLGNTTDVIVTVDEFLSNDYRPSFVKLTFKYCDFFYQYLKAPHVYYTTDASIPMKPWDIKKGCTINPGIYHFANLSLPLPSLPENFPFEKGRVMINHTYKGKIVISGVLDIEIKTIPLRKYKGRS